MLKKGIVKLTECNETVLAAYFTDALRFFLPSPSLPAEIISHCVWLYFRFALSFRDLENVSDARRLNQL
jgi:hypothetical protein